MIQEIIRKLINSRVDKPCITIPGYSDKPQPPKPFATIYLVTQKEPDIYKEDEEIKGTDKVEETSKYWGDFTFQFDVLGNTDQEARDIANKLRKLITYNMRYSDWLVNNIGIADSSFTVTQRNEKLDNQHIFRYTFDITFESEITLNRVTELAKILEVTVNDKQINIGGK
ncbi:MAG: hypothetical protein RSB50_06295 [Cetobacterium sp.]